MPRDLQSFVSQANCNHTTTGSVGDLEGQRREMEEGTKAGKVVGETIDGWLKKHRSIYICATRHPFILSIGDGTVDLAAFKTWLAQDYIFVRAFVPFVSTVLAKAHKESDCADDMEVILGGLAALDDELKWFKKEGEKWGVHFSETVPQKANQDYCRFLESLAIPEVEYTEAITTFFAIEAVYQESFAHCLEDGSKTRPELKETCERWGNDGFKQYCNSLKRIANRRLDMAATGTLRKSEIAFLRVLELEVEFWNMSRGSNLEQLAPASLK